ncbi:MAG: hypothetical protein NVS9B12_09630 [Vulcanimicrobiaceae bacterium]
MVGALHWSQTARIAINKDSAGDEHRRAAWNYLIWPMAVYETFVVRESKSNWFEFHTRQALWFGILAGAGVLVAFSWPVVVSAAIAGVLTGPALGAIIWIYAFAILIDFAVFAIALTYAVRSSRRAARGEMFEIPLVSKITRRVGVKR